MWHLPRAYRTPTRTCEMRSHIPWDFGFGSPLALLRFKLQASLQVRSPSPGPMRWARHVLTRNRRTGPRRAAALCERGVPHRTPLCQSSHPSTSLSNARAPPVYHAKPSSSKHDVHHDTVHTVVACSSLRDVYTSEAQEHNRNQSAKSDSPLVSSPFVCEVLV